MPDVVGLQQSEADTALRDAGLIPNFEEEDSDLPEGQVIGQNPAGGSEVKKDTEVTVRVSNGEGTVTVPNVEGQPEDTAVSQLRSRGATNIQVIEQETEDESLDGRVISQAPSAGSQIRASDQVTIYVGVFVEPEVPEEDPDADPDADPDLAPRPVPGTVPGTNPAGRRP